MRANPPLGCPVQPDSSAIAVRLRPTRPGDLPALFELDSDPESCRMAGTKPRTREAFFATWERGLADPGNNPRVIEVGGWEERGQIVGSIGCFQTEGKDCIGYSVARAHWGRGIASRALAIFLGEEHRRPLHATILGTNAPSRRILEKCGFRLVGLRIGEETERYVAGEIADFVLG